MITKGQIIEFPRHFLAASELKRGKQPVPILPTLGDMESANIFHEASASLTRRVVYREEGLESDLDTEDLFEAAKALVDAAICRHEVRRGRTMSKYNRSLLIQTVMENPALVGELFRH